MICTLVHSVYACVCVYLHRIIQRNVYIIITRSVVYGITYGSGARRSRMQHPAKLISNCIRTSAWNRVGSVFGPKAILSRALLTAAVVFLSYTVFFFLHIFFSLLMIHVHLYDKIKIRRVRIYIYIYLESMHSALSWARSNEKI